MERFSSPVPQLPPNLSSPLPPPPYLIPLQAMEDWLYDEGEDVAKSVYSAKLDELKKVGGENRLPSGSSPLLMHTHGVPHFQSLQPCTLECPTSSYSHPLTLLPSSDSDSLFPPGPIELRHIEDSARGPAADSLRQSAESYLAFARSEAAQYAHILAAERETVAKEAQAALDWLGECGRARNSGRGWPHWRPA